MERQMSTPPDPAAPKAVIDPMQIADPVVRY